MEEKERAVSGSSQLTLASNKMEEMCADDNHASPYFQRCTTEGGQEVSLEDFVKEDDLDMYGDANSQMAASKTAQKQASSQTLHLPNGSTASAFTIPPPPSPELTQRSFTIAKARGVKKDTSTISNALAPVMRICNLHIDISAYESKDVLYSHLRNLDLTREDRMRPGWDKYFMTLAGLASLR